MIHHFSEEITEVVSTILDPFQRLKAWKALKIPGAEIPSANVLLTGEPGTGKSTLARYILKKASGLPYTQIPMLSMADVASEKLGQTETAITSAVTTAFSLTKREQSPAKVPVLFIDECDAIGWDRSKVVSHSMFMLSIINTLLMQVDRFTERGGIICFATNHESMLDPALLRRMTDRIILTPPIGDDARKMWNALLPPTPFGFDPFDPAFTPPSWTPNNIQKWISSEARKAFFQRRNMVMPK